MGLSQAAEHLKTLDARPALPHHHVPAMPAHLFNPSPPPVCIVFGACIVVSRPWLTSADVKRAHALCRWIGESGLADIGIWMDGDKTGQAGSSRALPL